VTLTALSAVSHHVLEVATTPARIALIVVLAMVLRMLANRGIRRLVTGAAEGSVPVVLRPLHDRTKGRLLEASPLSSERRRQRAETIGSVLRSSTAMVIFTVAGAMILAELGFDLGPVIASAGIVGVAVGFGAQNLIKDFLNGMFMILEDQYGVGDGVDVDRQPAVLPQHPADLAGHVVNPRPPSRALRSRLRKQVPLRASG
jgi:small conductance mechanosensitive channel